MRIAVEVASVGRRSIAPAVAPVGSAVAVAIRRAGLAAAVATPGPAGLVVGLAAVASSLAAVDFGQPATVGRPARLARRASPVGSVAVPILPALYRLDRREPASRLAVGRDRRTREVAASA